MGLVVIGFVPYPAIAFETRLSEDRAYLTPILQRSGDDGTRTHLSLLAKQVPHPSSHIPKTMVCPDQWA